MFMDEDPVATATKEGPSPAAASTGSSGGAASTPAKTPAPISVSEPKPAAPAVAASAGAPSTRGWTKFMDAPADQEGEQQPSAPELTATPSSAAAAADLSKAPAKAPSKAPEPSQPSANGDGVHVKTPEAPKPSRAPASKAPQKSAVEGVNRRVAMGMPKPLEQSQEGAAAGQEEAPVQRARTMVMGGNKAPGSPPAPQIELSNPEVPVAGPGVEAPESSLVGKNPIPESPAPSSGQEPSLYRVAAGAGVAGIVLAGIVLLLVYLFS